MRSIALGTVSRLPLQFINGLFSQSYILGDIVPVIFNGNFLDDDLEKLRANPVTSTDADLLNAFMDQIAGSEEVLWKLLRWKDDHGSPHFNCRAIDCFQNDGYNIYRIRPLTRKLSKYRILYAYNTQANEFHFLAVVVKQIASIAVDAEPGDFYNYEFNHSISIRIRSEYDDSGFANTKR